MSATDAWTRLGSVPPADLHDTTLQLHWATQFIAVAGQSFADPKDDDSHRAMTWDANRHAFIGEPFAGGYPFRVAVRPADLVLQLVDQTDEPLGSLPLVGVTMQEGYEWLATGLAHYMGGLPELGRLDFELPEHPVANGAPFSDGRDDELRVLSALFRSAAGLLEALAAPDESASEVRCWPHHFDIATLVTIEAEEDAHSSKTIGIGMAPMGGGYDGWYWYVTPWPSPDVSDLPELGGVGQWHTEGWVGAVLDGNVVVEADAPFREAVVRKFIDTAVHASMGVLGE